MILCKNCGLIVAEMIKADNLIAAGILSTPCVECGGELINISENTMTKDDDKVEVKLEERSSSIDEEVNMFEITDDSTENYENSEYIVSDAILNETEEDYQ